MQINFRISKHIRWTWCNLQSLHSPTSLLCYYSPGSFHNSMIIWSGLEIKRMKWSFLYSSEPDRWYFNLKCNKANFIGGKIHCSLDGDINLSSEMSGIVGDVFKQLATECHFCHHGFLSQNNDVVMWRGIMGVIFFIVKQPMKIFP